MVDRCALAIVALAAACSSRGPESDSKRAQDSPAERTSPLESCDAEVRYKAWFAVGAIPRYRIAALVGEAAQCYAEFPQSDVVKRVTDASGRTDARLVTTGTFFGTCDGKRIDQVLYSVSPADVRVDLVATHVSLAPFALDSQHPDRTISLLAVPRDKCGRELNPGGGDGVARWTVPPACKTIVAPTPSIPSEPPGRGIDRPSDHLRLAPVGPGQCELAVRYGTAATTVTITVH